MIGQSFCHGNRGEAGQLGLKRMGEGDPICQTRSEVVSSVKLAFSCQLITKCLLTTEAGWIETFYTQELGQGGGVDGNSQQVIIIQHA